MPVTFVYPEGTPTLGNTKVIACAAVTNKAAPSLATEINAVTSVDMSGYFIAGGWNPDATTAKGTKLARLFSKTTQERFNKTSWVISDLMYTHDPQAAIGAAGNEAKNLLVPGAHIIFLERRGLDAQTVAMATTQKTRAFILELGPQIDSGDLTDENGEYYIKQAAILIGEAPIAGVVAT